jgi:hypothetical protein
MAKRDLEQKNKQWSTKHYTTQETNDRETRTQLKARVNSCSGRVDSSCSIGGAFRVTTKRQDYYMIFWIWV